MYVYLKLYGNIYIYSFKHMNFRQVAASGFAQQLVCWYEDRFKNWESGQFSLLHIGPYSLKFEGILQEDIDDN